MRAAYYEGHEQIRIGACDPVAPGPGQVRVQVSHCGICGTDVHLFHGKMDHRVRMPHVMGHEMSGVIESVGADAGEWKAGDRVTVMPLDWCGQCPACRAGHWHVCQKLKFIGIDTAGALQAMWTVPARTLHRLPDHLSLVQGALIEPIAVACHDIRIGELVAGETAVVIGGGPIGTLIALVARAKGANVVVTEINPFRIQMLRGFGLEAVDPRETDVVKMIEERTGTAGADVVFEVSGSQAGADLMTKLPRVRGRIVVVAIFAQHPQVELFKFFWRELKMAGARVYQHEDFEEAIQLAASGAVPLDPLITATYPLDGFETGLRQMEQGGEIMKVLIDCTK